MMRTAAKNDNMENRVLVFMPTGRDATLVSATLERAGIAAQICADSGELAGEIERGAGAVLLAEEGLRNGTLEKLTDTLDAQPIWSDIPIVMFAGSGQHVEILIATVGTRFNATIVERPIRIPILVSAVEGALRARARQYQSRDLLNQLEESDRQKDLFLATLSHELRTPLNSILGWLQLLNADEAGNQLNLKHALSVIERNARAQAEMISDILFVSRIITGKLALRCESVDIIAAAQTAVETLRPSFEAKHIQLNTSFDASISHIEGDADRLQQIFWNLLSNAIKFTPPRGQINLRVNGKKSKVEIEVSDSGRGIKAEFLPFVFERFRQADSSYTRQVGGLGLGLAIVRHLVEMHAGEIQVESAGEDKGATFTVNLPISRAAEEIESFSETAEENKIETEKNEIENALRRVRVLLVEDDEDSREMLRIVFEQSGLEVFDASSSAEALNLIEQIQPDVLISDIGLPGADGYELMRRVRQLAPEQGGETPAVALTGYASIQDRDLALDAGYQRHLPKPVDIDKLLVFVKDLTTEGDA